MGDHGPGDDEYLGRLNEDCDQIRRKIENFIKNGGMTEGEFQKAINVSADEYSAFMKQKGKFTGLLDDTFTNSWKFFKRRELGGLQMPRKKAKTSTGLANNNNIATTGEPLDGNHKDQLVEISDDDDEDDDDDDDDDPRFRYITENCDQVRRKINTFINNGGMKVGEFQKAINVGAGSYSSFMKQKGKDAGSFSDTYHAAWKFFKKRELKGLPMPRKTAKASDGKATDKATDKAKYDVSMIHLDGEDEGEVEIYETCDSLRRIVAAHLRKEDVTQAEFLRQVSQQFGNQPKKMTASQLTSFQGQKGAYAGSSSGFFYGAYVYFEKLRIKEKKPKSVFRKDMEDRWHSGFPRTGVQRYICHVSQRPFEDKYGCVQMHRYR